MLFFKIFTVGEQNNLREIAHGQNEDCCHPCFSRKVRIPIEIVKQGDLIWRPTTMSGKRANGTTPTYKSEYTDLY